MGKYKWIFFVIIVVIIVFAVVAIQTKSSPLLTQTVSTVSPTPIFKPFTATFAIYTNNTLRIFSDSRYHNLNNDVFITAENPHTVRINKARITWQDFFNTLPMSLQKDCLVTGTKQTFCSDTTNTLKFYINGVEVPNALELAIAPDDELLVSFGPINDSKVSNQLKTVSEL